MDIIGRLQFGIDIATSLAIIGALISWLIKEKREASKRKEDAALAVKRGINNDTRGIVLNRLQGLIGSLTDSFREMVGSEPSVKGVLLSPINDEVDHFEITRQRVESNPAVVPEFLKKIRVFRENLDEYYESLQKNKYILFPVLDSLPEGAVIIEKMKKDYDEILVQYNAISGGWLSLMEEFHALETFYKNIDLSDNEKRSEMINKVLSIIYDIDYWDWVESFVPEGRELEYKEKILNKDFPAVAELSGKVVNNFIGYLSNDPARLYTQIMLRSASTTQEARIACKEIICSLSGISRHVLSREIDQAESLESIIDRMKSQSFFDLKNEIR